LEHGNEFSGSIKGGKFSSVNIVTELQAGRQGPDSWQEQGNFSLSRLALGSTQPLIKWVPMTISPEVKWPLYNAKVKNM